MKFTAVIFDVCCPVPNSLLKQFFNPVGHVQPMGPESGVTSQIFGAGEETAVE